MKLSVNLLVHELFYKYYSELNFLRFVSTSSVIVKLSTFQFLTVKIKTFIWKFLFAVLSYPCAESDVFKIPSCICLC